MSKAAARKSTRLQTNSNARSEDVSYEPLIEQRENIDSEDDKPPDGKKRKASKKDAGGRQTTVKKAKKIRGMLKDVKDMPLDILFEIFSLLNPIDLVNLTRSSKDLREMLMSRSSISVWKLARANVVPVMSECPDELSEPQYAELVFGKGCHYCQRNLGTIHTARSARRRICNKCIDTHCSLSLPNWSGSIHGLERYLPKMEIARKSTGRYARLAAYYFLEFAELWKETYNNITDSKERESWKSAKAKERIAIGTYSALRELAQRISRISAIRCQTIHRKTTTRRVAYLGWSDDVVKMHSHEKKYQDLPEVVKICQKEFTDHTLPSLDAKINEYMGSMRQKRLKRERYEFLEDRLPILQKYPTASELFLSESQIQDIVNDASSTLELMEERLALAIPKIYPDSISQLIRRIDDQLLELIATHTPEQDINRETIFGLAPTVFECSDCRYDTQILQHNEAVLHSCTRMFNFPEEYEDRKCIAKLLEGKYRSHRNGGLTVEDGSEARSYSPQALWP